jgi:hypothetical protein
LYYAIISSKSGLPQAAGWNRVHSGTLAKSGIGTGPEDRAMYTHFDSETWLTPFGLIFIAAILTAWALARRNAAMSGIDVSEVDLLLPVVPVQLYEAALILAVVLALWRFPWREYPRGWPHHYGQSHRHSVAVSVAPQLMLIAARHAQAAGKKFQ